ncbi:MAG: hypothetical protein ABI266_05400 [Ginsengibacter sp.]
MPYELGLDIGASEYGGKLLGTKNTLILETKKYHYQKVLSDIAGQDIENHNDDPLTLNSKIRNWLSVNNSGIVLPGHRQIWNAFNQFNTDLNKTLSETYSAKDIEEMPIGDYIKFAKDWIIKFKV